MREKLFPRGVVESKRVFHCVEGIDAAAQGFDPHFLVLENFVILEETADLPHHVRRQLIGVGVIGH